jgi:hypothetical protein
MTNRDNLGRSELGLSHGTPRKLMPDLLMAVILVGTAWCSWPHMFEDSLWTNCAMLYLFVGGVLTWGYCGYMVGKHKLVYRGIAYPVAWVMIWMVMPVLCLVKTLVFGRDPYHIVWIPHGYPRPEAFVRASLFWVGRWSFVGDLFETMGIYFVGMLIGWRTRGRRSRVAVERRAQVSDRGVRSACEKTDILH